MLYLEVLKLNIKSASIGTGSHESDLHRNIILQPCIPHHRISLVIERIEDFNGIQPADSFNPNIRNRFIQRDYTNYIKAIEFVDGKFNLSTVVTHKTSDWSVITLDKPVPYIWIKAVRRLDAVEIFYSFDDKTYTMMRNAWLQDNIPVKVGFMAACPDGGGFNVKFENFKVKHLPDMRRLEWLKKNAE